MKRFRYKAKDANGRSYVGEVEATSAEAASKLVRRQNLIVISITSSTSFSFQTFKRLTNRVSLSELSAYTRQLATMINSGLPITEALNILRNQSTGNMQKIALQTLSDVEQGESLSTSLSKHPQVFSKTYIALIRAGEVGGVLDEVLARLADDLEKEREFRGKVKSSLVYPAVVIFGMVIVAFIMVIFVIPRLTTLYEQFGADLPLLTRILVSFSKLMSSLWPLFILGFFALLYGFKLYASSEKGRRKIDDLMFKLPLIGDLQKQIILTELTRTLSLMIGSGVSIIEAFNIASSVTQNVVISSALKDVSEMTQKGFPIAFAFSRHPEAFPFILSQMVSVGEETGKISEIFGKVSHVFEVESDQKLKALTSVIEPIILIFLGIGVAILVISIIMPIYNLTTKLSV